MTEWQHTDAARGRWQSLSLAEQFGNVGSEISRAIRWSTKNPATAQAALYRGLELFDLMLDDWRIWLNRSNNRASDRIGHQSYRKTSSGRHIASLVTSA